MAAVAVGKQAEVAVAQYLTSQGFSIVAQNWKTKVCEIDIIASKKKIVYFVEVKYRSSQAQGGGFEYIGPNKLNQLKFAARVWCQSNDWQGDYRLIGAEVSGSSFENIQLVELS